MFVTSRRCGAELRIDVRDTGVGIRAGALSEIFRAFQRADESRTDGLGLGLFIVKHAADLLRHRIEVRSAEGRGSCFTNCDRCRRMMSSKENTMSLIVGGLAIPDSKLAREITEVVRDTEPPLLFHHSSRVYYWGALTGKRRSLKSPPNCRLMRARRFRLNAAVTPRASL